MNTAIVAGEIVASTAVTSVVATSVNADPLLTALIGFGTSLVTLVGSELIKFLIAWFKKKRENIEGKETDDGDN